MAKSKDEKRVAKRVPVGASVPVKITNGHAVDMEGQVIRAAFSTEPVVETEPPVEKVRATGEEAYSEEDRQILQKRLSDLGYLE